METSQALSLTTRWGDSSVTETKHQFASLENDPEFVTGSWITLGASRFRRSTNYGRVGLRCKPLSPGHSKYLYYGDTVWEVKSSPGGYSWDQYVSGIWRYRLASFGIPSILHPPSFKTMELSEAETKSLNKLADNKANIGENLATLRMTTRLFANPVKKMLNHMRQHRSFYDRAKRSSKRPGWEPDWSDYVRSPMSRIVRDWHRNGVPETISEAYLAWVYGVKPLVEDVYSILTELKALASQPMLLSGNGIARSWDFKFPMQYNDPSAKKVERWTDITCEARTRVKLWAKLSDEWQLLRVLNQYGLLNPASVAWEVVPFSFLVDWLLPVGPVLNAYSAPAGLDFVNGSRARRVSARWFTEDGMDMTGDDRYTLVVRELATGAMGYDGYVREEITNWPLPGFYLNTDPLGLSNDKSDRIFKGLALAIANTPSLLKKR